MIVPQHPIPYTDYIEQLIPRNQFIPGMSHVFETQALCSQNYHLPKILHPIVVVSTMINTCQHSFYQRHVASLFRAAAFAATNPTIAAPLCWSSAMFWCDDSR
jgi:hypothetical protein